MDSTSTEISGPELRQVRRSIGLSQQGLASRLGVAAKTVWNWEASHVPGNQVPAVRTFFFKEQTMGPTPGQMAADILARLNEVPREELAHYVSVAHVYALLAIAAAISDTGTHPDERIMQPDELT